MSYHNESYHGQQQNSDSPYIKFDKQYPRLPKLNNFKLEDQKDFRLLNYGQNLVSLINDPDNTSISTPTTSSLSIPSSGNFSSSFFADDSEVEFIDESLSIGENEIFEAKFDGERIRNYINRVDHHLKQWEHDQQKQSLQSTKSLKEKAKFDAEYEMRKCFATIPSFYFESNFNLNQYLDEELRFQYETSHMRLNTLMNQLDLIEVCLLKQISSRFKQFFDALFSVEELHSNTGRILAMVRHIRTGINVLHKRLALNSFNVVRNKLKHRSMKSVVMYLELMLAVKQSINQIEIMIRESDFTQAIAHIFEIQKLLSTQLSRINCLTPIKTKLESLKRTLSRKIIKEFVQLAINLTHIKSEALKCKRKRLIEEPNQSNITTNDFLLDLEAAFDEDFGDSTAPISNLNSKSSSPTQKSYQSLNLIDQRLSKLISSLYTLDKFVENGQLLSEYSLALEKQVQHEIKSIVHSELNRFVQLEEDVDSCGKESNTQFSRSSGTKPSISNRINDLSHFNFIKLIYAIFDNGLLFILNRIIQVKQIILSDLSLNIEVSDDNLKNFDSFFEHFDRIFSHICEFCHKGFQKIFDIRIEVHSKLELFELRSLFDKILGFVVETERMNKGVIYILRQSLHTQALEQLNTMHSNTLKEFKSLLEKEDQTKVKVPHEYQEIIDRKFFPQTSILKISSSSDVYDLDTRLVKGEDGFELPYLNDYENYFEDDSEHYEMANSIVVQLNSHQTQLLTDLKFSKSQNAVNEDSYVYDKSPQQVFNVVYSMLYLIKAIQKYIECAFFFKSIGLEVLDSLIELIKLFNSHSCGLVLNAGATQLAGLKTITSKHLSLLSQCLGLLITQISVIKETFEPCLPEKRRVLLKRFDIVTKDLKHHRQRIFNKIIEIMRDIILQACKELVNNIKTTLSQHFNKIDKNKNIKNTSQTKETVKKPIHSNTLDSNQFYKPFNCVINLMKSTRSLRRALSTTLAPFETSILFKQISAIFSELLCKYLSQLDQVVDEKLCDDDKDLSEESQKNESADNILLISKEDELNLSSDSIYLNLQKRLVSLNMSFILGKLRTLGCSNSEIENQLSVFVTVSFVNSSEKNLKNFGNISDTISNGKVE